VDFEKFKTPLADGDVVTGHSRNGVDLQVEGEFGSVAGTLKIDEPTMLQAVMTLRGLLHVDSAAEPLWTRSVLRLSNRSVPLLPAMHNGPVRLRSVESGTLHLFDPISFLGPTLVTGVLS